MLGGISLTDDAGVEIDALLRQSKHVALLAYLASPKPGTWHKRDSVLGTFWAEHDQARSRSALRSALYTLRRHLPENAIRARGDNDLSVDPQLVATDTAAMAEYFETGDYERALECYRGEFLPGIYVADAETFEQWLEQERRRTRSIASRSARRLSEQLEAENDLPAAITAARRNYELDPDDESTARRLISLLDASGDRAQAFAVYEEFRNHLSEAFGVRPSAETVALLDAVRTRHEPGTVPTLPLPRPRQTTPAQKVEALRAQPVQTPPARHRSLRALALLLIPLAIGAVAWIMNPRGNAAPAAIGRTLVVLPVTNETGDASVDYIATGIGDDLARRLANVGGFTIRSAALSDLPEPVRSDLRGITTAYKANFLLRTSLKKVGDSLLLASNVVDGGTLEANAIGSYEFSQYSISDAESKVAAAVAGTVFRRALPPQQTVPVDPESYRLTLLGYHQLLFNVKRGADQRKVAHDLFMRAVDIDPQNARAWAGISSIWASQTVTDQIPFDEGFNRASAAADRALALDSSQGAALANMAGLRALKYRRYSLADPFFRKAEAAEPWNPEVYFIKSVLYRNAHLWDESRDAIRIARSLDPLNSLYIDREAIIEFCAGRPAEALDLYKRETPPDPGNGLLQGGITRALAMLARYDEALDSWKLEAQQRSDTALLKHLEGARGKDGYWGVRHALGRERLAALEKRTDRVSPLNRMQALLAAGDSARGFEEMDRIIELGLRAVYRLQCMADVDEFRDTDRFKAALAKVGGLPK